MYELCFASNLTSSELAAWVQAIGSIGAILTAVWIMDRQHRVQMKRQDEIRHARIKSAHEIIRVAAMSMESAPRFVSQFDREEIPDSMMNMPENSMQAAVRNVASNLTAALKTLEDVPHQLLDEPVLCGIVSRMKQSAVISLAIIDSAREAYKNQPYTIANVAWTAASTAARSAIEFEKFLSELADDGTKMRRMVG